MADVDLYECRCHERPCKHLGVFRDEFGRDLPGLARLVETLDWATMGRYRPIPEIMHRAPDELPVRVRTTDL